MEANVGGYGWKSDRTEGSKHSYIKDLDERIWDRVAVSGDTQIRTPQHPKERVTTDFREYPAVIIRLPSASICVRPAE